MQVENSQINDMLGKANAYAKATCRKCHGRGYRMIQPAPIDYSKYGEPQTQLDYCDCVIRNYKKMFTNIMEKSA
jgi:hypothetical protein